MKLSITRTKQDDDLIFLSVDGSDSYCDDEWKIKKRVNRLINNYTWKEMRIELK